MAPAIRKKIHTAFTVALLSLFSCGFLATDGCSSRPPAPVVATALGPAAQKLLDEQKAQIEELQKRDAERKKQLEQVAGSSYGIDIGVTNIQEQSRGVEVVKAENNLIKQVVGEPTPEKRAEADARTIAVLQNDLAAQKELYGAAIKQIDEVKKAKDAADAAIAERDKAFTALEASVKKERIEDAKKIQTTINSYEGEIQTMKNEQAAKERRLWVNTLRFGGFGIIVLGIIALALSKGTALIQGLILIGGGAATIAIGVAIDVVTSQWWFPAAACIVGVAVAVGIGWYIYHLFDTNKFADKSESLLNDIYTEATTLASSGSKEAKDFLASLEPHVNYRFGGLDKLKERFVKSGLDEKGK